MKGLQDIPVPRALTTQEVQRTAARFAFAARRAIEAGADGVEIHGANAYLIHQFLAPSANARVDQYGGSIQNRARFAIEVARRVSEEIGSTRTAMRLSPGMALWGIDEGPDWRDLYRYLVEKLDHLNLAYLHVAHQGDEALLADLRHLWKNALILNRAGRPRTQIGTDLATGLADLESYGQLVLANPDFAARLQEGTPMNAPDRNTFFGGAARGYTDYPVLHQTVDAWWTREAGHESARRHYNPQS